MTGLDGRSSRKREPRISRGDKHLPFGGRKVHWTFRYSASPSPFVRRPSFSYERSELEKLVLAERSEARTKGRCHSEGEERFAEGERNGPVDHFERRTPRAKASGREQTRAVTEGDH
jgi:hypothetical protein